MGAVDHFIKKYLRSEFLVGVLGFFFTSSVYSYAGPEPQFSVDVTEGCTPLSVNLINQTDEPGRISYTWKVYAGEGDTIAYFYIENPHLTITEPGTYSVSLKAEKPGDNSATIVKENIIHVFAQPELSFSIEPRVVYVSEEVRTSNFSSGAVSYSWNFGEDEWIDGFEPTYFYSESGEYTVWLTGVSEEGCTDTTFLKNAVRVRTGGLIQIPNAFTPAGSGSDISNGINDIFTPKAEGVVSFEMKIYDRYGNLLFVSEDHTAGWNGTDPRGRLMPYGVYFYSIKVEFSNGVVSNRLGDVTLIR